MDKPVNTKDYTKILDIIEYAKTNNLIAKDVLWYISSGEITIHPFKERIYELVKNDAALFFSNCFIFDEKIASNLAANPRSLITLSIDCGTSETWCKIKGIDNFETIIDNLTKYRVYTNRPFPQILLKYILLPGINDTLNEFRSLINIMNALEINTLQIASDSRIKYSRDGNQRMILLRSAGYLVALLKKSNKDMFMESSCYTTEDKEKVTEISNELLKSGEV